MSAADLLRAMTREIPDFPEPGVLFRDLTPVLADGPALAALADALTEPFADAFDVIAGVEARGFALAAAAAARSGHGLLLIRKAGKLPGPVATEEYALEYGTASLEVHVDQLPASTRVLVVDDVLATGGTLGAAHRLVRRAGWVLAGTSVALELESLGGRAALEPEPVHSVLSV